MGGKKPPRDIENMNKATYSVKAHESIVNCIDGCGGLGVGGGCPELVTGGRDGCVKVNPICVCMFSGDTM